MTNKRHFKGLCPVYFTAYDPFQGHALVIDYNIFQGIPLSFACHEDESCRFPEALQTGQTLFHKDILLQTSSDDESTEEDEEPFVEEVRGSEDESQSDASSQASDTVNFDLGAALYQI